MNPELEKLVDYALADGYISDKEKQVLRRKAETLGFDPDELELILNGKLQLLQNNNNQSSVEKCPSCGEIITGLSRICPACNYVLTSQPYKDDESLQQSLKKLEQSLYTLKTVPKPASNTVIGSVVLAVITGGLYVVYKKLIKKETLFDRYASINERIIIVTDLQAKELKQKYGTDKTITNTVTALLSERDAIIAKRQKGDITSAILTFTVIVIAGFLFTLMPKLPDPPKKEESAEQKTERFIKEKKINAAKTVLLKMEDGTKKDDLTAVVRNLEIDSLAMAGNYAEAMKLARQISNKNVYDDEQENKIDEIIEKQVNELIDKKEFKNAAEIAELASYSKGRTLMNTIKVSETIDKNSTKKHK